MDPTTKLASEVRLACQLVSHKVRFESESTLAPHQLSVLWNLKRDPLTPGELADIERVTAPSMTKTIACLEGQGLVERANDPDDGRRRIISITDDGLAALDRAANSRDSFMVERLSRLTDDERAILARAASILEEAIR